MKSIYATRQPASRALATPTRRAALVTIAVGAVGISLALPGIAQENWPSRPVNIVVTVAPGGPADTTARVVAQKLSERWQRPVVVTSRVGASGSIGGQQVAQAVPDGYTLLLMNNASNGAYEVLNPKVAPYKSDRDFAAVGVIGILPSILIVNQKVPAQNMAEFIQLVRANPGKFSFSSSAIGAASHLTFELLQMKHHLEFLHVPYSGSNPAVQAVVAGDVTAYVGPASTILPHIQSGRVRALAVLSKSRSSAIPDLPTMAELGFPGVEWDSWLAIAGPAKVPPAILDKINSDLREVLSAPETRASLLRQGVEAKPGTRAEMSRTIKEELERTTQVVRAGKIATN